MILEIEGISYETGILQEISLLILSHFSQLGKFTAIFGFGLFVIVSDGETSSEIPGGTSVAIDISMEISLLIFSWLGKFTVKKWHIT